MKQNSYPSLIVFLRNPALGKGKTRIAAKVGHQKAYDIYLQLLKSTRELAARYPGPTMIYYSEFVDENDEWQSPLFEKYLQKGESLGDKIKYAFNAALKKSAGAIIIGSDCPYIEDADLLVTIDHLKTYDIVMGPAEDGGYYLLGLNEMRADLFEKMPWSTDQVAKITKARAEQAGMSTHLLRTLSDIDEIEDWEEFQRMDKINLNGE